MARLMLALAASSALVEGLLVSYGVAIRPVAPQLARQVRRFRSAPPPIPLAIRCFTAAQGRGFQSPPPSLLSSLLFPPPAYPSAFPPSLSLARAQPFARMAEQTEAEEMSEEEYLAELEREQADDSLSPEAKKVYWNMRSESGVEFAPWMKVDPEAIARAEAERKARKERQMAAAKELDTLSIDPQAAELGAGETARWEMRVIREAPVASASVRSAYGNGVVVHSL